MKTNRILIIAVLAMVLAACGAGSKKSTDMEKRTQVKIETTMGNIVVELYNETPKHRDNFIKLAKEGMYDSTLFHRVIKAFMIQAGDPDSKNANDTAQLGGLTNQTKDGLMSLLDMFSGGAFSNASIFALGIMPYISASIVVQLLAIVVPSFQKRSP